MRVILLVLLATGCVSAEQREKPRMRKNTRNGDVEVLENNMVEFMEKLNNALRGKHDLSPEQQQVLQESLQSFKRKSVDEVTPKVLSAEEVNMESGIADKLFQGDIVLSQEQQKEILANVGLGRPKRQASINENATDSGKWTKLVIPYELNDTLSKRGKAAFRKAAKLWTSNTCINITERVHEENGDEDEEEDGNEEEDDEGEEEDGEAVLYDNYYYSEYEDGEPIGSGYDDMLLAWNDRLEDLGLDLIMVRGGNYCGSSVGRQLHGSQSITLGRKCETIGTAAHELGHALGFWHTHVRHDRDQYVTVNWPNIDGNYTSEFEIQTTESNVNYGLPYDYGSVMHYRTTAASTNGGPTIVPKDGLYTQTLGSLLLSFYDIFMMNKHYNCTGLCSEDDHKKCNNHGFAHPRNCSKCICPSGYGGDFCDERPPICGEELNVTSGWTQLITANSSAMTQGGEDGYKRCVYWLKAPIGSNIEVNLMKLPENVSADGCIYAGVEIKALQDQALTGYRFCSKDDANTTLTSNSSTGPVIVYSRRRRNATATVLEYRIAKENSGDGKLDNLKT